MEGEVSSYRNDPLENIGATYLRTSSQIMDHHMWKCDMKVDEFRIGGKGSWACKKNMALINTHSKIWKII
jgi:hypothetical protein